MKKLLLLLSLILASGCSQNHFNVPADNFAAKVKVLGVAPIIIDTDSDIRHPQKNQLISLITYTNRKYEQQLVRKLKDKGNFFTVTLLDSDPQNVFSSLFFRREKRNDATIQYNKYFWKNEELRNYLNKNHLDAVMLVIVSGITKTEKISSPTLLSSLTGEYNYLIITAQILDAEGTILWEYPNFRKRILSYNPVINLQYPDFSEADANMSTKTNTKFKTIEGIKRALEQKQTDMLLRETHETKLYGQQFNEMAALLQHDRSKEQKDFTPPAQAFQNDQNQFKTIEPPDSQSTTALPASKPEKIDSTETHIEPPNIEPNHEETKFPIIPAEPEASQGVDITDKN